MTPEQQADPFFATTPRRQRVATASLIFFVLAYGALMLARAPGNVAAIWLATAFGVGILLRQPRADAWWLLVGMLVAGFAANLAWGDNLQVATWLSVANVAEVAFVYWLASQVERREWLASSSQLVRFLVLLAAACTLGPAIGATLGTAGIFVVEGGDMVAVWRTWWAADALGMLMLLPVIVSMRADRVRETFSARRLPRLARLLAFCVAVGCLTLTQNHDPFVVLSLPLVLAAQFANPFATALLTLLSMLGTMLLGLAGAHFGMVDPAEFLRDSMQLSTAFIMAFPICVAFLSEQSRHDRAELRSSERHFRQAMQYSAIGMALVGIDGRWQQVNRALRELTGYSEEELARMTFPEITHPDDLAADLQLACRLVRGDIESYRLEKRFRHKDGHYIWTLLAVSLVRDDATGAPIHYISQVEDISERKAALQQLEAMSRRTALAVEAGGVGIWEWDIGSGKLAWDKRMHALNGTDERDGCPTVDEWVALLHPEDVKRTRHALRRALRDNVPFDTEYRILHQGEVRHIRALAMVVRESGGSAQSLVGTNWDITGQRRLTEALFEEKERLHITLRSIGDAVICTDSDMRVTFMNPIAEQLTGWTMSDATGEALGNVFCIVDEITAETIQSPVEDCLRTLSPVYLQDGAVLLSRSGERHDVQDSAAPVRTATGDVIGAVLVFQNITTARALQRELAHSASHDALTNLPNRVWFEKRLREACEAARHEKRHHILCFIDLDRFKIVNDTAGHAAGDVLLRELGHAIRHQVRPNDVLARLGGDEFALLLMDCSTDQGERICQKIIDSIRGQRFPWEGRVYDVGASIGITAIDLEAPPVGELMSRADVACYAAKAAGRSRVSVYRRDESDAQRHHQELQVAAGIHQALEANRFRLFAQEIRALSEEAADGQHIEILVRMVDEDGNLIMPGAFIPAAERYDLMGHIDRWVIKRVLRNYAAALRAVPDLIVAINLSANSLGEPFLLPFLHAELSASVLPASRIQLEITETALINNMAAATGLVAEMRRAGCTVALDDFGAGLSSFAYLKQFPVDYLKIDGSFIRHLAGSAVDREIVSSINDIGHRLGMRTVAESVEDEQTLHALRAIGVDHAQGYAIGRPVPLETFLAGCGTDALSGTAPPR